MSFQSGTPLSFVTLRSGTHGPAGREASGKPIVTQFEQKPSSPPVNVLPPDFGMTFRLTLPEPDSAPMPLVSSCISAISPWSVT